MNKIALQESKLLIEHAIASCQSDNITQKQLAKMIGLDEPRISEAKNGSYRLHSATEKTIIDKFGYPKRASGQYVNAELYNSLDAFINDYRASSKNRYIERMMKLLNRDDYQNIILSNLTLLTTSGDEEFDRNNKLKRVEEMLSLSTFKAWVSTNNSPEKENSNITNINNEILNEAGFQPFNSEVMEDIKDLSCALFRLAIFKYDVLKNFSFFNTSDLKPLNKYQIVLTGNVVYKDWPQCDKKLNLVSNVNGAYRNLPSFPTTGVFPSYCMEDARYSKIRSKPDFWTKANIRLFLNEKMEYNLWIQLVMQPYDIDVITAAREDEEEAGLEVGALDEEIAANSRNIVISNLNRGSIFSELEELRKWLGLSSSFNEEVKRKVASLGGYIPGARVL